MESIEILKIKINGVLNCINGYTSEPFIKNIVQECKNAIKCNNLDILIFSCNEVSKWYDKNINDILSNEYVYNKEVHKENQKNIKNIVDELTTNQDKYKKHIEECYNNETKNTKEANVDTIINLMSRFHLVVKQLRDRYSDRETLDVSDEYDVQDLLHSLLYIYCDDVRSEEWTPSYAGKCSRQDFLLKNEKIVIETKKTRKGLDSKKLAEELIIDIARYKSHPDCKTLICFVYDPEERISNPRGIEADLTRITDGVNVIVVIKP